MPSARDLAPAGAWQFIILLGVISLLSDITYEGARSISGPFLGELKASALVVGVMAGLGGFWDTPCAWPPAILPTVWAVTGP